jgi:hypothetical protein
MICGTTKRGAIALLQLAPRMGADIEASCH